MLKTRCDETHLESRLRLWLWDMNVSYDDVGFSTENTTATITVYNYRYKLQNRLKKILGLISDFIPQAYNNDQCVQSNLRQNDAVRSDTQNKMAAVSYFGVNRSDATN